MVVNRIDLGTTSRKGFNILTRYHELQKNGGLLVNSKKKCSCKNRYVVKILMIDVWYGLRSMAELSK